MSSERSSAKALYSTPKLQRYNFEKERHNNV